MQSKLDVAGRFVELQHKHAGGLTGCRNGWGHYVGEVINGIEAEAEPAGRQWLVVTRFHARADARERFEVGLLERGYVTDHSQCIH